jgi:hypothetical protein
MLRDVARLVGVFCVAVDNLACGSHLSDRGGRTGNVAAI